MHILGLSAFYHDSSAALIKDGKILAAAEEERFSRKKHDARFPENAIRFCISSANITWEDIAAVVFYDKPLLKFDRLLETYISEAPRGFQSFRLSLPLWIKDKLFQKRNLLKQLARLSGSKFPSEKLLFSEHHLSHAASAFFPSPFEEAAVLTLDGVGEWSTTSYSMGKGSDLEILKEISFPNSLGLLYSAFTYHLGFKVNSGEYKVMGLAPYGVPKYEDLILENVVDIKNDGSFRLNQNYFDYCHGLRMTNENMDRLLNFSPRKSHEPIQQTHMDLAASIQSVLERCLLKMTRSLRKESGVSQLCLAGGVALNCVANGRLYEDKSFKKIWVQPASGDSGGAIGAALAAYYIHFNQSRSIDASDSMSGALLGPRYSQEAIELSLQNLGAQFRVHSDESLIQRAAQSLAEGKAMGWFQGRMEFGPRALGNRSILADARSPQMQSILNLKIKFRESFRPFAPAILYEKVSDWFEFDEASPYMLFTAEVKESRKRKIHEPNDLFGIDSLNSIRSDIPAATHVDYSARIQTVHKETNLRFYELLKEFERLTGCPLLVNTSFNIRGEPIVCTPAEAFQCFMATNLDTLVMGNCILEKSEQTALYLSAEIYKQQFESD